MIKKVYFIIFFSFYLFLFNSPLFAQTAGNANICTQQQCVKIQNGYLQVLSADNVTYVPYFIKAVGYEPMPIGRAPDDWGYASTDPRSINNNIYDDPNILNRDFSLLQQMNANTIRIWSAVDTKVSCQCANNGRFPNYITNAGNTANANSTQNTLDIAASYGLKVIPGFWVNNLTFDANNNIGSTDANGNALTRQAIINNFVAFVNTFKANRAILFWAIGNENNYLAFGQQLVSETTFENQIGASNGSAIYNWLQNNAYIDADGDIIFYSFNTAAFQNSLQAELVSIGDNSTADYNTVYNDLITDSGTPITQAQLAAWYSLVDDMALAAHNAEGATFHPVAVVNGEIATIGNSADGSTDAQLPNLDIWGTNIYRGSSFYTLFSNYAAQSSKPLWISEYGVDAWRTTSLDGVNNWGLTLADDLGGTGNYDPTDQSTYDTDLWNEMVNNFPLTIGGSLMEYSDEWWKPGQWYCTNPNVSQADNTISSQICNNNQKYFGFISYGFPDNFSNEEWYGVVAISPNPVSGGPDVMTPRSVYSALQTQWQTDPWPNLTLNMNGSGMGTISSSTSLGAGLSCNFSSGSSTGNCSAAFIKNQPVTLSFSSNNNSTVTNWGISGCANGSTTCNITPDTDIILNVTVTSPLGSAVNMTSPSNNSSFTAPASITLTASATASPNATISNVAFYNGATLLGTVSISPYTFIWNKVAAGTYNLTAVATESTGAVSTSSAVSITVTNPVLTVVFGYYAYSSTAPGSVYLSAVASEAGGGTINKIAFYNGSTLISSSTSVVTNGANSSYAYIWNNLAAGTYSLTAQAYDNSNNNVGTSAPVTFTINPSQTTTYTITATAGSNGSISPAGVTTVNSGASQTYTITPNSGYTIAGISINGTALTGTLPTSYTFTNVTANQTIGVTFAPVATYTITATAGSNGSISPAGVTTVNSGASQTYTVTPNSGYTIAGISINGTALTGTLPTSYTFTNVTANQTISVTFAPVITYTITATAGSNGNISPAGVTTLNSGASKTYTITPNSGYTIAGISVNGTALTGTLPTSYTFTNVTANQTISTTFAPVTVTVPTVILGYYAYSYTAPGSVYLSVVASEAGGGAFSKVEFYNGTTLIDTSTSLVANEGYSTYSYVWNNVPAGNYSLTAMVYDTNNNVGTSAPVTFTINPSQTTTYTITATSGGNGSISPTGISTVNSGGSQTYTITPNSGYTIAGISINGTALTGALPTSYTFTNVTANQTISVTFAPVTTYTITATAGSNGSISPTGISTVNSGGSQTYTITPNSGYTIAGISINGTALTGALPTSYTFTNVTANQTISVTFAPVTTYTITATAGSNGSISPMGISTVNSGGSQTYTITPNSGYTIAGISINGTALTGTLPTSYTFTNVTANQTISATFVPATVTITVPTVVLGYYAYSYSAPGSVYLSAVVSEAGGGTFSKIEIYNGSTLIDTSTSLVANDGYSTYSYIWNNVPAGNYNLTAKVYDTNNNVGTSPLVTFTIQ